MLPEAFGAPGFQVPEVITGEVLDGFSEFSGEEFLVGAHTEKDVLAKAKHAQVSVEVGGFSSIMNAAIADIVPL